MAHSVLGIMGVQAERFRIADLFLARAAARELHANVISASLGPGDDDPDGFRDNAAALLRAKAAEDREMAVALREFGTIPHGL